MFSPPQSFPLYNTWTEYEHIATLWENLSLSQYPYLAIVTDTVTNKQKIASYLAKH